MLDIVYQYACRWRFEISGEKSNIILFNKSRKDLPLSLSIGETGYETDAWRYRTSVDPDFSRFRHLHSTIRPCTLYRLYNFETNPKIIRLISNIWVVLPYEIPSTCPLCLEPITDEIDHVLSNCIKLNALKTAYIFNIMMYVDRNIADELSSDEPNIFSLKVLGSEINSGIQQEQKDLLLQYSAQYSYDCLLRLL